MTYQEDIGADVSPFQPLTELEELTRRLARGHELIEERRLAGHSVERLEDHWIALLREYEALYDSQR